MRFIGGLLINVGIIPNSFEYLLTSTTRADFLLYEAIIKLPYLKGTR